MKKIVSVLLVMVMLFGAVSALIPEATVISYAAGESGSAGGYLAATDLAVTKAYKDIADKLESDPNLKLQLAVRADNGITYQLYANAYTGEVVYYNTATGKGLTTNPYDMAENENISESVKAQLMSQVVVSYKGTDGTMKTMYSFTEAARRGQIQLKPIKGGFRIQYAMGRENANYLMPGWITEARFEKMILDPIRKYMEEIESIYSKNSEEYGWAEFYFLRVSSAYTKQDPNEYIGKTDAKSKTLLKIMQKAFPITAEKDPATGKNYVIYTVDEKLTEVQKASFETLIRTFCPDYSYEEQAQDNQETQYVSKAEVPALFKLSLEYTINKEDGSLDIRLPANGILYDETLFQLESISTLNYLGAGAMSTTTYGSYFEDTKQSAKLYEGNAADEVLYDGYLFYPDGSGAIFEFSDLYTNTNKPAVAWSGKVYGQDYAYYTVTGKNQEVIRLPIYGVVSTTGIKEVPILNPDGTTKKDENNKTIYDLVPVKSGFVAILEEGEAMTNLSVAFGATRHNYASVFPTYYPRPKDTYDLSDSISVSGETEWTVVADRKYTGNYRTRVVMLSEDVSDYAPSWVGMAKAYRDYLLEGDILSPLMIAEGEQIPLYIEAFGAYETQKQVLSMPVNVKVPLTTFEDIGSIYTDLSENAGIHNLHFKLTGFANGGIRATYPAKLNWEKAVGGKSGFRDLISMADEKDFGVYPDFDFSYISNEASFDGVSLKKLGARTVDNRYCSKQVYDAVYQQFMNFFDMCVATNLIDTHYEKLDKKLSAYQEDGSFGLSVGTLGSDLNSSFDEDNPINREEAKRDVANLLSSMKESYGSLMLNGGNAFAIPYADHILGMPLSGSNYRYASASVPFMAMVLHGYVNYAGAPINMSGDTAYSLLKSIENGAYPYFLLSYNTTNTMLLKKDKSLSKYYSIRYDIWRWQDPDEKTTDGTLVEQYNKINSVLSDLQTATMENHEFIRGERVLKEYEKEANKAALEAAVIEAVRGEIDKKQSALLEKLGDGLGIYALAAAKDAELAPYSTIVPKSVARRQMTAYLENKDNGFAHLSVEERTSIVTAYIDGKGLADLRVMRGLRTVVNTDEASIWAAIEAGVRGTFSAEELARIRTKVQAVLAEYSQNATAPIYAGLASILGVTPNDEQIAYFNWLVYSGMDDASVSERAAEGFSVTLDAAKVAEMLLLVKNTRDAGQVLVVGNTAEIDFNFNTTDSSATDGDSYADTAYTLDDERIVMVTYRKANGTLVRIVLNYNIFDVTVKIDGETHTLGSYGWKRIDS